MKSGVDPNVWFEIAALFFAGMLVVPISLKLGEFILDLIRQWRNDQTLQQAIQQTQADYEAEG